MYNCHKYTLQWKDNIYNCNKYYNGGSVCTIVTSTHHNGGAECAIVTSTAPSNKILNIQEWSTTKATNCKLTLYQFASCLPISPPNHLSIHRSTHDACTSVCPSQLPSVYLSFFPKYSAPPSLLVSALSLSFSPFPSCREEIERQFLLLAYRPVSSVK